MNSTQKTGGWAFYLKRILPKVSLPIRPEPLYGIVYYCYFPRDLQIFSWLREIWWNSCCKHVMQAFLFFKLYNVDVLPSWTPRSVLVSAFLFAPASCPWKSNLFFLVLMTHIDTVTYILFKYHLHPPLDYLLIPPAVPIISILFRHKVAVDLFYLACIPVYKPLEAIHQFFQNFNLRYCLPRELRARIAGLEPLEIELSKSWENMGEKEEKVMVCIFLCVCVRERGFMRDVG